MKRQHLIAFYEGGGTAQGSPAATGYNPCPGSKPLANHVPRGCTNPFPTLTLMISCMIMIMIIIVVRLTIILMICCMIIRVRVGNGLVHPLDT